MPQDRVQYSWFQKVGQGNTICSLLWARVNISLLSGIWSLDIMRELFTKTHVFKEWIRQIQLDVNLTEICKCAQIYPQCFLSCPSTPHRSTPPCSCAAGQLFPFPSVSLFGAHHKKLPLWLGEDIIAIMTARALNITQCTNCSTEEEGANTQMPHNIIIACPHTFTHARSVSLFLALPVSLWSFH